MAYAAFLSALSLVVGILGGLTGTGGILIPPVLIEAFNAPPHVVMGSAMASFIVPSVLAVIMFMRRGQMDWSSTIPLAVSGSLGTFVAAQWIKPHLDASILTFFLSLCIIAAGSLMLRPGPARDGQQQVHPKHWLIMIIGLLVGLLTGLTGSGGNAILVPVMVTLGMNILTAVAACQVFTILTSVFGTIGNHLNHALDYHDVFWLVFG